MFNGHLANRGLTFLVKWATGGLSYLTTILIPLIKLRWSCSHVSFIMEIPIPTKTFLFWNRALTLAVLISFSYRNTKFLKTSGCKRTELKLWKLVSFVKSHQIKERWNKKTISTTRVISGWRNHRNCKHMFMFLLRNLAGKGLMQTQVCPAPE